MIAFSRENSPIRSQFMTIAALFLLTTSGYNPLQAEDVKLLNPLALTRLALVTDIDAPLDEEDPGTGGNFDAATYFQTKLADPKTVTACLDAVELAATTWAKTVSLNRALKEATASKLDLHYVKPGLPGLFVVDYRVEAMVRARVSVNYYSLDGAKQAPETALSLIAAYQIAGLQDALDKALLCNGVAK